MRLGVVSDNHRLIDPALPGLLAGCAEIVHAGDLVTRDILPALADIAPVHAVRGNNDVGKAFRDLPEELVLERDGWRILVRHIVGRPGRIDPKAKASIARAQPQVVIAGHSHRPLAEEDKGIVFLNPGSCGPRRFSLPRSAALLELTPKALHFKVLDLDSGDALLEESFGRPLL